MPGQPCPQLRLAAPRSAPAARCWKRSRFHPIALRFGGCDVSRNNLPSAGEEEPCDSWELWQGAEPLPPSAAPSARGGAAPRALRTGSAVMRSREML